MRRRTHTARGGGRSILYALAMFLTLLALLAPAARACRFWAAVGDGYPQEMIEEHLRSGASSNLRVLGLSNPDGWGFGWLLPASIPAPIERAIIRRGGEPASDPWSREFDSAVDEMIAMRPSLMVGHVRHCSAGYDTCRCGIPNPHPFERDGFLFGHNGHIPIDVLVALLLENDPDYLDQHRPGYVGDYIDSELYFLYLLKAMHEHPELTRVEALRQAILRLTIITDSRLNFVLASGDTLFALRYVPTPEGDPVRYYPGNVSAPSFWVAASQVVGSNPAEWGTIPAKSLALLVPGHDAVFVPIGGASDVSTPLPETAVSRAHPNPSGTRISIPVVSPAGGGEVSIAIIDAGGRLVWHASRSVAAGQGTFPLVWDERDSAGRRVPSGSYSCRITTSTGTRSERLIVVR